jgi:N6-L-threonylcarbamoyladenine synthase
MKDIYIMAIETSCDETSIAIIKNGHEILSHVINSQAEEFSSLGGVVPEMASRMHVDNICIVYKEALTKANLKITDIDAIATTFGPGLVGSLLVGVNFANTLSSLYNIKLIGVNHMQGHIYALEIENKISYPMMSLIVSGGHTELVYVENEMEFKIVGQTLDDAAGESYDKVAKMLGLGYPGGPLIDKLAQDGKATYKLPTPMNDDSLNFSFSGLKSACFNQVNTLKMKNIEINEADFACSFQTVVVDVLLKKLVRACELYPVKSVSVVGGVSANSELQKRVKELYPNCMIPSNILSTDNAAMIGVVGYHLYKKGMFVENNLNAKPNISVEQMWIN